MPRTTHPLHLLTVLLLSTPSLADLGATPDLVLNGGFEQGMPPAAADWGIWPPRNAREGVSSEMDGDVRHSGQFSGRLRVTNPAFDGVCTWHHPAAPVEPGQEIVVQFWIKAEGVKGSCGMDVQLREGVQQIVGGRATASWTGTFDWRRETHRFIVPEGVDHICLVPLLRGTGTVWFDDVSAYGTPTVTCSTVEDAPEIDGLLSEACWDAGSALSGFRVNDGSAPDLDTRAWVVGDSESLYFAFHCPRKPGVPLVKTITQRDGPVWMDDDVEVFISTSPVRGDYCQFVVNPLGTRYDSRRTDASWNADWTAAARESPDAWTVEMAIPVSQLPLELGAGSRWFINLGRADKACGQASSWSCTFGGFHNPARFGALADVPANLAPRLAKMAHDRLAPLAERFRALTAGLGLDGVPATVAGAVPALLPEARGELDALEGLLAAPETVPPDTWPQLTGRIAALDAKVSQLAAAALKLRVWTEWGRGRGQPSFGLAVASPLEKVFRDGQGFQGDVSRALEVSAAGNEYESAQIVVVSLSDRAIESCRVSVGDLVDGEGHTISRENVKVSRVGYIETGEPGYATLRVGAWPDPLLPDAPFTLRAGELQPIWLRLYVPPGTPKGEYTGTVSVSAGEERCEMSLKLRVFGFDLPRRQHLATPFGCAAGEISRWYTGSSDYKVNLPPEVFTRWNQFLLDYRVTPTAVGQSYVGEVVRGDGTLAPDYTVSDACMEAIVDRLPPLGVSMASVGQFGWHAANAQGLEYVRDVVHSGERAGLMKWPKTDSWASLSRPMAGRELSLAGCKAFRFWVKPETADLVGERVVAFVNNSPDRWITTFTVAEENWHEVRIPISQYRHNQTGEALNPDTLAVCGNFQFVIDKKDRPLRIYIDDLVAECEGRDVVIDDFELKTEIAEIQKQVGQQIDHWREKGWLLYGHVYGWDEARPEEYEAVSTAYRRVLEVVPDAPIMQTYYTNRTPADLNDTVRIWCALTANQDDPFFEARRAEGDVTWLYVCCGPKPPYANFFIDQPAIDHRVLFWQTWQKDCTGFLYWRVNYWFGLLPEQPDGQHWPDEADWDCRDLATYKEFKVNGDGWLIYPGRDFEPLSSVRLETVRDGIEDYEYLWLLRELDPANPLLQVGEDISQDYTHFSKDPGAMLRRREAVAGAIEGFAWRATGQ